jgi:prepilin-type N-terminal cleavage/methylation domain-containing protein
MSIRRPDHRVTRAGFTMLELMLVVVIMGVFMSLAIPKMNTSRSRAEGSAQQIRSVFLTAQRTSLTRQYDVIVSFDTVKSEIRIGEDANNDGVVTGVEWKFWRSLGEGTFMMPTVGSNNTSPPAAVLVGTFKTVDGMPSIIFHRDGSTSSDAEIYVGSPYKGRTDFRMITLTRSTGRSDLFRLSGNKVWIPGTR